MLIAIKKPDYKNVTEEQPAFNSLSIPADIIRAAMIFQAKNDVRYYISGIYLCPEGFVYATNGHIAIEIECEECKRLSKGVILSIGGAKINKIVGTMDFISLDASSGVAALKDRLGIKLNDVRSFYVINAKYPNVKKAMGIPGKLHSQDNVPLNPDYLAKLSEVNKIIGMRDAPVKLEFSGPSSAIHVSFMTNEYKARAVIMPCRW